MCTAVAVPNHQTCLSEQVWVNSIITVDQVQGADGTAYAHFHYLEDDWHLVRRDAGSLDPTGDQCWHPADDQLRGTAEYGENDADPLGIHTFSLRFEHLNWQRLLFSSGDMSLWLVISRPEMETCSIDRMENHAGGSTWFPDVTSSSLQNGVFEDYQVTQYCREGVAEDPWISIGEHPDRIVYGEGGWCGGHWGDDAPTLGGSNVRSIYLPCLSHIVSNFAYQQIVCVATLSAKFAILLSRALAAACDLLVCVVTQH